MNFSFLRHEATKLEPQRITVKSSDASQSPLLAVLGSLSKLTRQPRGGGHIQISIQLKGGSCQGPTEFTWP